jgi:hypothetical protein
VTVVINRSWIVKLGTHGDVYASTSIESPNIGRSVVLDMHGERKTPDRDGVVYLGDAGKLIGSIILVTTSLLRESQISQRFNVRHIIRGPGLHWIEDIEGEFSEQNAFAEVSARISFEDGRH